MKFLKTASSIVFALLVTSAFGQIEQATKFLGGTLNYVNTEGEITRNGQSFDGPNTTSFLIAPSFGYMVTDKIGLGFRGAYESEMLTYTVIYSGGGVPPVEVEEEEQTIEYSFGLFGRYYIPLAGEQLFFHLDLGLDFGSGTVTSIRTPARTSNETEIGSLRVGLTPGFDYFIGEKWAIEANLELIGFESTDSVSFDLKFTERDINFGVDFTRLNIGARWYF